MFSQVTLDAMQDELQKIAEKDTKTEVLDEIAKKHPHLVKKGTDVTSGPKPWGQAAKEGLHHEGPGAGGMLLGTIVGGRYGRPLEGAALGYGAGAGLGLLGDAALRAVKKGK